ncbi:MAG: PEP/pyruvate-binding domain-containing protein [Halioglobus sp.]
MASKILPVSDITDVSAGGKAYGLSRLCAMNLPVPPAFVLLEADGNVFPDDLDTHYARLGSPKVAVRSSAVGEDGADASFAGQYDTVLNVEGVEALREAVAACVRSVENERAQHYVKTQTDGDAATMNVVVQTMVDARAAGVVFTADPVSARRDLLVIDAVEGLGEALVSGEATPDHYGVHSTGDIVRRQLTGEVPILRDAEIALIAAQAREAAAIEGQALDLEWAIDQDGSLYWLQARPITTLPADLNEFDTQLPGVNDILTISNVSEMMPGAVCPLTGSFTGWGIDYGLQDMQVKVGAREAISPQWQITAWGYGHLFLNLSGNIVMSAAVLGSSAEQTAQSLCGRLVPELKDLPPLPLWRRVVNTGKLLNYCRRAPAVVENFGHELAAFKISEKDNSAEMVAELVSKADFFDHAMAVHIQSSALSGFFSSIVENMVSSESNQPTVEEQAEAVRLLAGATDVESAVMLEELDALVDCVARQADALEGFGKADAGAALTWLTSTPEVSAVYAGFLNSHGHRGYRELCVRDPSWGDDPAPLIQSMQAAVKARAAVLGSAENGAAAQSMGKKKNGAEAIDMSSLSGGLRWALPRAHDAIRRREHTKSQLVDVAHRFTKGFSRLGKLMESEGKLPDADLINFFHFKALADVVANPTPERVAEAEARREAFVYQQQFEFPEISVGMPQPLEPVEVDVADGVLIGRPASRGTVEGTVRVAHTLDEAAALQPGEILVTPITDIGWTPYFSLIAGLITDLGSSVSHGAVIAREYGLPCVVNTRQGTRFFKTGDRALLDGDSGKVTLLEQG